jgi:hypothetical protein
LVRLAVAVIVLVLLSGCSDGSDGTSYGGEVDGPLLTSSGSSEEGLFAEVRGRVTLDDGCLLLRGVPVVWPEGTSWDRTALTLASGTPVEMGERVSGGGGYLTVRAVRELFGDEVASAARQCLGPTREVAVFNRGWEVTPLE